MINIIIKTVSSCMSPLGQISCTHHVVDKRALLTIMENCTLSATATLLRFFHIKALSEDVRKPIRVNRGLKVNHRLYFSCLNDVFKRKFKARDEDTSKSKLNVKKS